MAAAPSSNCGRRLAMKKTTLDAAVSSMSNTRKRWNYRSNGLLITMMTTLSSARIAHNDNCIKMDSNRPTAINPKEPSYLAPVVMKNA
jgi:hypothetical protein